MRLGISATPYSITSYHTLYHPRRPFPDQTRLRSIRGYAFYRPAERPRQGIFYLTGSRSYLGNDGRAYLYPSLIWMHIADLVLLLR